MATSEVNKVFSIMLLGKLLIGYTSWVSEIESNAETCGTVAARTEVQRVLRPGGMFLFVEHVAAPEGDSLRFWQKLLDPLQQLVADGCHLQRDTLSLIEAAQFASVNAERVNVNGISLIAPHVVGSACVS